MTTTTLVDVPRPDAAAVPRWSKVVAKLGMIGVALAFVGEAITILRANHAWLIHRVPDDGFYYLEIARRLARGEGPTFDGVNQTSGFHPLWEGLLVPVARAVPGDDAFVKAALLLALGLLAVAIVLVTRVLARAVGPGPAWVGALVVVHTPSTMSHTVDAMEGAIVVLALALVVVALERFLRDPTTRGAIVLGGTCALAALARMDLLGVLWLVPVLAAVHLRRARWLGWWAAGLAAVGLPAAIWWYARFGHVLSTSATVKSGWLEQRVSREHGSFFSAGFVSEWLATTRDYFGELIGDSGVPGLGPTAWVDLLALVLPVLALGGLGLALVSWSRARRDRGNATAPRTSISASAAALSIVGVAVVAKAAIDQITEPDWALAWYSAPVRVVVGLAIGVLAVRCVAWLAERVPVIGVTAAVVVGLALVPAQLTGWTRSHDDRPADGYFYDQLDLAASWLREHPQPGRYGAKDAGIVGYRLDPIGVVNIDGLVNDYDFAAYLGTDPTVADRVRREAIEVYVGRLSDQARDELSCATTLWTSPGFVPMIGGVAPVYVLDTRACAP